MKEKKLFKNIMGFTMSSESAVSTEPTFQQTYHSPQDIYEQSISQQRENLTESEINFVVNQVLLSNGSRDDSWGENLNVSFTIWEISELENVRESESGIRCLLNSWLVKEKDLLEGTYCNATWDNVYCWPATPLGSTVSRTCLEAFAETQPLYASYLKGNGYRVCQANGSWQWGSWTNYTECADSFDALLDAAEKHIAETELVKIVQYILCIGSIFSLICLASAVTIFYCFRVLWCDRVTIHIHLMASLILRYTMLFIITEPHIFKHKAYYRSVDKVCKGVLFIYLYATLASISWMFIQGVYINGKLSTNIFNTSTPFKVYYTIGWLLPFIPMTIWATIMHLNYDVHCWSRYSEMDEIWIIICPIIFALIVNFLVLINILRIMLTKVHTQSNAGTVTTNYANLDALHLRRAAKATIFLFPLLGINNLLFLYIPEGDLHKYFVILNTLFGSTQGIFVAILYCYLSYDIRAAFRHVYRRYMARRNANLIRRRAIYRNAISGLIIEHPLSIKNIEDEAGVDERSHPSLYHVSNSHNSSQNNNNSSHFSGQNQSKLSNSPSQNTRIKDVLGNITTVNIPVSQSTNSITSLASQSSCHVRENISNSSGKCTCIHSGCGKSGNSCILASPEHSLSSSTGAVFAAHILATIPPSKEDICGDAIPLRDLNDR